MSLFDKREQTFESKFAHDQENEFKLKAKSMRFLGEWAATKLKIVKNTEKKAFVESLLVTNLLDFDHCLEVVAKELEKAQVKVSKNEFLDAVDISIEKARKGLFHDKL